MKKILLILLLACLMTSCTEKNGSVTGDGAGNGNEETDIIPDPIRPEIFDVENMSKPLIVVDNPESDVFIPMELTSVSEPVEGVPSSPVHTKMDFGVYIQQETVVVQDTTINEGN